MGNNKIKFNNDVKIGDKFNYNKHTKAIIVDILRTFSTAKNEWSKNIYIAKGIDSLATNEFEVSKTTVARYRIN